MIKNGYLDENKSVVMVSVENQSTAKADDLAASLNQVIKDSATAENISATVVRQTVTPDSQAVTEAEQYSVSTGKLNVMKELIIADSSLNMETLAAMSLTDLLEVSKEKSVDLTNVIKVDEPEKETKDLGTPTTPTEVITEVKPPESTSTPSGNTNSANGASKETPPSDPVVILTPETPVVTIVDPPTPTEPIVTPPEKETEAIDEEKKPLSENPPTEPEEQPAEVIPEEPTNSK
jgi:hypothetical protein